MIELKQEVKRGKPFQMPKVFFSLEREFLLAALQESNGVKAQAAQILGIHRQTFDDKLRKHDIQLNEPES